MNVFIIFFFGIFIFIVLMAVVVPVGLWLGRRARGSITVQIPNRQFHPAETVEGIVQLASKRNLGPGRLSVSLVCTEEWREWTTDHDGDRTRETKRQEVYRDDTVLGHELAMEAGTSQVFPFAFRIPQNQQVPTRQSDSTWGRLVVALGEMGSRNSEFIWEIESRYDIPGLDLVASERINLHLEL